MRCFTVFARLCLMPLLLAASLPAMTATGTLVVDTARLFDGQAVIEQARMVIEDGRVIAVGPQTSLAMPEGAEVIDHSERFVMPGLIAGHSHVGMVSGLDHGGENYSRETVLRDLVQFQRYGVVAVNALGLNRPLFHELRREMRGTDHGGADLYGAGAGVGAIGGLPPAGAMGLDDDQVQRPESVEEAREVVRQTVEAGVDMIKIWVDSGGGNFPTLAPEIYAAVIDEAHTLGVPVAAHVHDLEDARHVVEAGVDIIAHGVRDGLVDEEFTELMVQNRVWYIPTLNIDEANYIYAESPQWLDDEFFAAGLSTELRAQLEDDDWRAQSLQDAEKAREAVGNNLLNLALLHGAGVRVALGTDSGATALRIPGFAEHRELELMVSAGLTALEALHAGTAGAAQMMRLEDRGTLTAGSKADFLVLTADPTQDILATRSLLQVWRNGQLVTEGL